MNSTFNFTNMIAARDEKLASFRKENGFYKAFVLVGLDDNQIKEYAEIRFYATKSTNYCCVWLHSEKTGYGQTGGKAGGYGYDREEAALSAAAAKHGISGQWFHAQSLLSALADHLGLTVYSVISSNA